MRWSCLALALALATSGEAIVLRGTAILEEASGEWAVLEEAEAQDRSFLLSQLDATESELVHLQQAVGNQFAALQVSAAPVEKKATVVVKPANADPMKMVASLGIHLPKGLMGQAALAPMLGMMKGLYEDSKQRISQQNTREAKSKKWFASKEAEHTAKLAQIEGKFANHTLSLEFRTNETHDENRYFNYWQRCRERQHRQFHTNLKIQHGMMSKVKKMINMYEKALSTKASDQKAAKKQLSQMTGMPDIMFLQSAIKSFCQQSLTEVRKERSELQQVD